MGWLSSAPSLQWLLESWWGHTFPLSLFGRVGTAVLPTLVYSCCQALLPWLPSHLLLGLRSGFWGAPPALLVSPTLATWTLHTILHLAFWPLCSQQGREGAVLSLALCLSPKTSLITDTCLSPALARFIFFPLPSSLPGQWWGVLWQQSLEAAGILFSFLPLRTYFSLTENFQGEFQEQNTEGSL